MSWAEFRIRLHGFRREQKSELLQLRELAWITYIAPHSDPKKMKKSIDQFWPIGKKKGKVTDKMIKAMEEAQKRYLEEKNGSKRKV